MAKPIKLRVKVKKDQFLIKALMTHPMETGLRKDKKTGKMIPAHHITEVVAKYGDETVLSAVWGGAISKNPYLSFKFKGDERKDVTLSWMDNKGNSASETARWVSYQVDPDGDGPAEPITKHRYK